MPNSAYGITMAARPFELEDPRIGRSRALINQRQEQAIADDERQNKRRAAAENAMARYYRGQATADDVAAVDPQAGYKLAEIENLKADNVRADNAATVAKKKAEDDRKADIEHKKVKTLFAASYGLDPADTEGRRSIAERLRESGDLDDDDYSVFLDADPATFAAHQKTLMAHALSDKDDFRQFMAEQRQQQAEQRAQQEQNNKNEELPSIIRERIAKAAGQEQQNAGTVPITPQQKVTNERAAMPNTPTELAVVAEDPKQPQEKRAAAEAALKRLTEQTKAGRSVVTIQNHAPGLGGPGANPNLTGDEFLKTLPPATAAAVRAIASGNDVMPAANARSQAAQDVRAAVYQFDPNFSVQRSQVRKAFTTGPDAKNIGALNTAMVHLGRLDDAAEALDNGSFTPGNEAYNYLRDKFGSDRVTNFTLLKDAVAGEMATALKGSATDKEIEHLGASIRGSNSPKQMKGVVSEGLSILNDKANTYNERYHQLMPDDPWTPVLPSARAAMAKRGVTPSGGNKRKTYNPSTGKLE